MEIFKTLIRSGNFQKKTTRKKTLKIILKIIHCNFFRAGLKSSLDEGTPAATIQEPDLGRVFDVAAYGKRKYFFFRNYIVENNFF